MTTGDRISEILLQWEDEFEQGRDMPAEELCQDCPELVGEVAQRIESLKRTAWLLKLGQNPPAPAPASTMQPGHVVSGRYRLDRQVGIGGFGEVWDGFDLELQRRVAVKAPRQGRLSSPNQAERFLAEARRLARLKRSGIVAVYDVLREEGQCFIITEFIDGVSLAERLRQGRPGLDETVRIVGEIAGHLAFAHGEGFVHADVKPLNILLDAQGRAYLTDFGIAGTIKELNEDGRASIGTLAYASPEQIAGQPVDARTDLYSLGVVFFELLTGQRPFEADTPTDLRNKVLHEPAPTPRSLNPLVPKPLDAICLRCLAKSPAERYPSAQALADGLSRCLKRGHRHWRLAALGGGVFLLALLAVGISVGTRQTTAPGPGIGQDGATGTQTKPTTSEISTTPDTLPETEPAVELFNGKNLDGWTVFLKTDDLKPADLFKIKDGCLVCTGQGKGYLRSSEQFKDFILRLEWRLPPGGPMGKLGGSILVRMTGPDRMVGRWPEIKIGDGKAGDLIWVRGKFKTRRTLFNERPVGEWNQLIVVCEGRRVTVILNGKVVNRAEEVDLEGGNVGIMSQDTEFWVRKVQVEPIKERKTD